MGTANVDWIYMHPALAFSLVTIVAVSTSFMAYVFDWNVNHVYSGGGLRTRGCAMRRHCCSGPMQLSRASILWRFS
jgi:hypothetical protein